MVQGDARSRMNLILFCLFFGIVTLFGGASRADVLSQAVVRVAAIAMIVVAILQFNREQWHAARLPVLFILLVAAVLLIQLIPLPPGLWASLPGRSLYAEALAGTGVPLIADGGIRYSGDITKALAGGAYAAMIGGLFAGLAESPGQMILYRGRSFKAYRGMGSLGAMTAGSADRYSQGDKTAPTATGKFVPEGVEGRVPYKGPLAPFVFQLVGGLRAGMGYVGAKTLEDLRAKARFIQVSAASVQESHPHDIAITQESPNYSVADYGSADGD